MKSIVLIAIVFLATANCSSLLQRFPMNYSKKRSVMAVMLEVESKIKAKSPLDAILNVLSDFRDAVNNEQVQHDEIYNVEHSECASEFEYRRGQVTDATTVLRDSQAQLNACQTQKIRVANYLEVNEQRTFQNQEHLRIVDAQRQQEEALYKKRQSDYADALNAIEEAQDILASIFGGNGSFIELSKVSKSMLQSAMNLRALNKYAPILSSLAQLAIKERALDDSALERVAQLLDTLKSSIKNAYDDFLTSNAEAVQSFNEQKERLSANLNRLGSQAERLENQYDHLSQCIGTQSAISQTSSNKLSRNQQLWDQSTALCATFDNEYNYATQQRRSELQLVTELEEMVERRFGQVEDENAARQQRLQSASL